jgi:AAA+ superfamily predicted ATPase
MARSDLLISLAKAGTAGDQVQFRKTLEAIVAEERAKKHDVLANQLDHVLHLNGASARTENRLNGAATIHDLCFEVVPNRSLGDLLLPDAVSQACHELIDEHSRREVLRSYSLSPRHRILLVGPPGNGKTSLAEALAHALMVPFLVVRYDGLIASFLGETALRLRKLFDFVRSRSCVLFFDEFDTLGKERGDVHETGEVKRVVSSLLLQIDSLPPHVVIVTATNHPELLDRAVWRRFQMRMELPPPTKAQIEKYLDGAASRMNLSFEMSHRTIGEKLAGCSYSELEEFTTDIARRYVLSLPVANLKRIVTECIDQWHRRPSPRKH